MVVAANQDQLLVRSLDAFLHRNQQKKEYSQVKSDLKNVMRDLGRAESSSDESDSSSDSDVEGNTTSKEKHQRHKKLDKASYKRSRQETTSKSEEGGRKVKRCRQESEKVMSLKSSTDAGEKRKVMSSGKNGLQKKSTKPKQLNAADDKSGVSDNVAAVTTPKRSKLSMNTASPVVSISSSSDSSNPNTPEQPGLSRVERQLLALKELQWTPPHATTSKSQLNNQEELTDSAVDAASVLAQLSSTTNQVESKSKSVPNGKKSIHRMKAQALFTDIEDNVNKDNCEVTKKVLKEVEATSSSIKKAVVAKGPNKRGRKMSPHAEAEKQNVVVKEPKKVVEDNQVEPAKLAEKLEEDAELDEELEQLEQYEPEFASVPLVSDNGSLLAATMYQYTPAASTSDIMMANTDKDIENVRAVAATEQVNLLMQFSRQNERLKMNFLAERERIYKHPDCSCVSHSHPKKSSSSSGVNWRRNVAHDYLKRKQLKRRHKKQLAAKLQQLHASYAVQIQELYAMQQMEANAFRARQQFQHLHREFRRQTNKTDSAPSSPNTVASPIKHAVMPDHLSGANFPYPDLLS
ncbi:Hypothetical protein PHPALM_465 [Phytophthora palmivora]|uniref:Uncharacterized protein n=1 Tax=Phytophthora palmivora TaxID=4796 RepID=A0A2P4YUU0_9STRA|nr:Hypothetical protein PHPALM_465 [Phytophthora palmivora]